MFVPRAPRTHWSPDDILRVLSLIEAGVRDRAIAAETGVSIASIRNYRQGRLPRRALNALAPEGLCATCGESDHDFSQLPPQPYGYLLGVYLGDGMVGKSGRAIQLRVFLDSAYPGIIEEVAQAITAVRGRRPNVRADRRCACTHVTSAWKCWPCLFPQHGSGRKHERIIELTPWQQDIVDGETGAFLRGLIHTDGWRGDNRVVSKGHAYTYPRYQFSNRSDDIRALFTRACDGLGIAWRPWGRWHISVARREAVAVLDRFVGLKT